MQGALEWLEENQDKSIDDIKASTAVAAADTASEEPPALAEGEEPRSMVCDDCGKKFRSAGQVEWHANKTLHQNFSQSTEEIAPLTEEEKKAKLAELRDKLTAKRAGMSEQDKADKKKNEVGASMFVA